MFEGLFDKETTAHVQLVTSQLSQRSLGSFMFIIPTYMEGEQEAPCGDLDGYVRVYVPDSDVQRSTPAFGSLDDWLEHGVLLVTKPIGTIQVGQGTVIPISIIADHNPSFQVEKRICDTVRQNWYESDMLDYLKKLESKLRG